MTIPCFHACIPPISLTLMSSYLLHYGAMLQTLNLILMTSAALNCAINTFDVCVLLLNQPSTQSEKDYYLNCSRANASVDWWWQAGPLPDPFGGLPWVFQLPDAWVRFWFSSETHEIEGSCCLLAGVLTRSNSLDKSFASWFLLWDKNQIFLLWEPHQLWKLLIIIKVILYAWEYFCSNWKWS